MEAGVAEHGDRVWDGREGLVRDGRWKMVSLDIAPGGASGGSHQPQTTAMVDHLRAHGTRQVCNALHQRIGHSRWPWTDGELRLGFMAHPGTAA
jgi:hypothetical protein